MTIGMARRGICLSLLYGAVSLLGLAPSHARAGELGMAITSIYYGPYDDPADCPNGLALTPEETLFKALRPSQRREFELRDKRVGSLATYVSRIVSNRRGPKGEDLCEQPAAVNDPPMPLGQSKTGYGLDLDGGDRISHAPHQEFTSPERVTGIDNQVARLTACIRSVRLENNRKNQNSDASILNGSAITLIRISGVDNLESDDDVLVEIDKSADKFIKDGNGAPLPDATMHADGGAPAFHAVTHGRIVKGELITDGVDARFMHTPTDWFIRGARFRLRLNADGHGDGLLAGYFDAASFWDSWAKESNQQQQLGFSCPALYAALQKMADGYRDPASGKFTALSTAFKIKAVRAFVVPAEATAAP